jgi:hypothetical protein
MVNDKNLDDGVDNDAAEPITRKRRSVTTVKPDILNESKDIDAEPKKKTRSSIQKATSNTASSKTKDIVVEKEESTGETQLPTKAKKPPAHQVITEKDEIPKLWDDDKAAANGSYSKL